MAVINFVQFAVALWAATAASAASAAADVAHGAYEWAAPGTGTLTRRLSILITKPKDIGQTKPQSDLAFNLPLATCHLPFAICHLALKGRARPHLASVT